MDDDKIVDLFYERSEEAIVELSKKYGAACLKIARNILKNNSDAEECVNDAYYGAWNTIPPQNPRPLFTYLYRIVRNLSIKRFHKNTAQKRNSFYDVSLDELEDCFPDATTVEDEVNVNETSHLIDIFLDCLDKQNRVMFVRRYWFSDSVSDIAKRFNMSNHAVTVRLSRTREKLRAFLIQKGVTV